MGPSRAICMATIGSYAKWDCHLDDNDIIMTMTTRTTAMVMVVTVTVTVMVTVTVTVTATVRVRVYRPGIECRHIQECKPQ